jgi:hypothetical protein
MEVSILSTRSADRARFSWHSNLYFEQFTSCESPFPADSIRENNKDRHHTKNRYRSQTGRREEVHPFWLTSGP